jgi:hypothetical protein
MIKAEERNAFQACLDKQLLPKAALGDQSPRHGEAVDQAADLRPHTDTHDPASAFAAIRGIRGKRGSFSSQGLALN